MKPDLKTVGILGSDFPGVKPALLVSEGGRVSSGDVLFQDKRDARICAFSPVSGLVTEIHRGAARALTSISIGQEESEQVAHDVDSTHPTDSSSLVSLLLAAGLWTRLRQRPFGLVPLSTVRPQKLFVTALDSRPGAPDPMVLVKREMEAFKLGLEMFCMLPTEQTLLCLGKTLSIQPQAMGSFKQVTFHGRHPGGLPGTHIHKLSNPTPDKPIVVVDARTVVELGQLLNGVKAKPGRSVEISGEAVSRPGAYPAMPGVSIRTLLEQAGSDFDPATTRVVAGSALDGRQVGFNNAFLGVSENQLQVLTETPLSGSRGLRGLPVFDRTSLFARLGLKRFLSQTETNMNGVIASMVPAESFERVWPHSVPVIPLLRALVTEDDETALELGALAFVEEDMSLVSWACPGKYDYGQALRAFLNRIQLDMS